MKLKRTGVMGHGEEGERVMEASVWSNHITDMDGNVIMSQAWWYNLCSTSIQQAEVEGSQDKASLSCRDWLTLPHCCSSPKEVRTGTHSHRAGTWRQELMQKPWRGAAYWLAYHGLLSLLSYRTQDNQPRDGTTHHKLVPPLSITNQ